MVRVQYFIDNQMANWNIGSISTHVGTLVGWSNIAVSISGTVLNNLISQEINFVESYTGQTIDDNSITDNFQPAIIDLSMGTLLMALEANTSAVDSVRLGELSVTQNVRELGEKMRIDGMMKLRELAHASRFKRSIGGN